MDRFDIDMALCMYCGLCVESCPTTPKSIVHTNQYETTGYFREDLVYEKEIQKWLKWSDERLKKTLSLKEFKEIK